MNEFRCVPFGNFPITGRLGLLHVSPRLAFAVCLAALLFFTGGGASASDGVSPRWTGDGPFRLIVRVEPLAMGGRAVDKMVARHAVNFEELLRRGGLPGRVDPATLQMHRFDPRKGEPLPYREEFDGKRSRYDRPVRFDDDRLPDPWPARVGRASLTEDGRPRTVLRPRKGRLFNNEVDGISGHLVWTHTQEERAPSYYAVYFDVTGPAAEREGSAPAPWIGDGDVLRRMEGQLLGGFSHFCATIGDLNGDGLFDILAGTEKGDLIWFPNRGEPGNPKFVGSRPLMDEQGPIDTGWYAAPFLYDWNGNGRFDLLVGTSGNVILWWENMAGEAEPLFRYRGFVQADGGRLEVPEGPVYGDPGDVFRRDYYNRPWVGDFTGNGVPDILTGGYVTGRIFLFEGTGRGPDGLPQLRYAGPVEADGEPIHTIWAASPFAADVTGDGRLELLTGSWWWSGIPYDPDPGRVEYVMFYRNKGTVEDPVWTRVELPSRGSFPRGQIARPTVLDWNDNGLPDLFVSDAGGNAYVFLNVGAPGEPKWELHSTPLTVPWGFAKRVEVGHGAGDLTGDMGRTLYRVTGSIHSPVMEVLGTVHADGVPIDHPGPGYGDPYLFTYLHDWDGDGRADLLWGTHQGNIYLHRSLGLADDPLGFAPGEKLKLFNGEPLRVGPPVVANPAEATDFTVLQGSRIRFTVADFDGDAIDDLLVTETFGNIWFFKNTRPGGTDTFEPGVMLAKLPSRTHTFTTLDWNGNGRPDLLVQGSVQRPGHLFFNASEPGAPALSGPHHPFELPYLFWNARFNVTDWNRDGDDDLIVMSEFYTFWVERSFLEHGYRPAERIAFERRGAAGAPRGRIEGNPPSFLKYNRDGAAPLSKRSGRVSMGSSPVDWNGNGRLDLLADQRVYFQREDGLFEKGDHLGFLRWSADVELTDVTGNGLWDIVESRWGRPEIRLFRNIGEPGRPQFATPEVLVTGEIIDRARPAGRKPVTSAHPHVVDWNGNGLPDLLVVCRDIWTDYFPYHPTRDIGQRGGRTTFGQIYGEVYFLPNRGTAEEPRFPEAQPVLLGGEPLTVFGISAPVTVDWNGNGRLDLILTQEAMPPLLFLNKGTTNEPALERPRHLYIDYPGIYSKISVVDWNGNGLFDLLVSSEDGEFFFRNEGVSGDPYFSGAYEVLQEVADKLWVPSGFASPWAVDLTGNGLLDLVVGAADGHFRLFRNTGGRHAPSFAEPEYLRHPCGRPIRVRADAAYHPQGPVERFWGYTTPVVVDWNGNGKLDLLSGQIGRFGYLFYENVGQNGELVWAEPVLLEAGGRIIRTTGHARMRPAAVDWNGNGLPDLVAVNDNFEYVLYLRERDADGRLRLGEGQILLFEDGSPVTFTEPGDIVGRRDSVSVVDWNGNGKWDIITGLNSATGGFKFVENVGTNEDPVFARGREMHDDGGISLRAAGGRLLPGFRHNPNIQVIDWNGDGTLDLLVGQDLGFILFYQGTGIPRRLPDGL